MTKTAKPKKNDSPQSTRTRDPKAGKAKVSHKTKEKPKIGRPSKYSQDLGTKICTRLAQGESLRQICMDENMPDKSTVLRWLFDEDKKEFCDQYARAREIQAENWADEILEIADDSTNDWVDRESKDGGTYQAVDQEVIGRSRLRVDSRKWLMSKLLPKKYGDKQQHEHAGPGGTPIQHKIDHAGGVQFDRIREKVDEAIKSD